LARSTRHFLKLLDEFARLNIEFVSVHENLDTGGALGRAIVTILAAIAELERSLIRERVRAGMRRAQLEGRHIGRRPAQVDQSSVLRDRDSGHSLTEIAKSHHVSRALISKIIRGAGGHKGGSTAPSQLPDSTISTKQLEPATKLYLREHQNPRHEMKKNKKVYTLALKIRFANRAPANGVPEEVWPGTGP
jgi:hypothetical protein